jgi:hypothetical protein
MRRGALAALALLVSCGGEVPPAEEAPAERDPGAAPQSAAEQASPGSPSHDWLVVADTRIGPVTAETTERELIDQLGPSNVVRRDAYLAEGFCAPGSVLYPGAPDEVEILWTDTTYAAPASVRVSGADSRWRTTVGVRVGSTLAELEQKAGGPVVFGGFGWDYGGGASWAEPGARENATIGLQLAPDPDSTERVATDPSYAEVLGERTVRSDHPIVRRLGVRVERMSVYLGRASGEHECKLP